MKTLLLFIAFQMLHSLSIAQTDAVNYNPQNYSDSIALAKVIIKDMDYRQLDNLLHNYESMNQSQSSSITEDIMNLLEARHSYLSSKQLFNSFIEIPVNVHLNNYADSILLAKKLIEDLGISEFQTVLEHYRYLNHTHHEFVNQEVLSMLEEKFKIIANEN